MPPKPGVHSRPDAFIHAMPAYLPALHAIGLSGSPATLQTPPGGPPDITGLLILNDEETGLPSRGDGLHVDHLKRTGAATAPPRST